MSTKILDEMTPLQIKNEIIYAEKLKDALIEVGKEFIKRIKAKENEVWIYQDTWRFGNEDEDYKNDTYLIINEWYSMGETNNTPYFIPYRAINDMDGAVEDYFKEKARQKAQQEELDRIKKKEKEQEEYNKYLQLKRKYEKGD